MSHCIENKEGKGSAMHNECESTISLDQNALEVLKFIFKQIYDPLCKTQ